MEIFSLKNVIHKSWSAKFFPSPQTRRQVSAYATVHATGGAWITVWSARAKLPGNGSAWLK